MARPPNIDPGGLSIPSGYVLGRVSPGTGRQELIAIADLGRAMVAQAAVPSSGAGSVPLPVSGANGGTGVVNTSKTITLGGNLVTSGAFATTLTVTADTNSTLPSGTHTLAGLDVAQTWSALQTFTATPSALFSYSLSGTGLNSAGGRIQFQNTDATADNWIRTFQAVDSTGASVGQLQWQVKDHTNHESHAVVTVRANGGGAPTERVRVTSEGFGVSANFIVTPPQADLHVGGTSATARSYRTLTDASNGSWGYMGDWGFLTNVCTYGTDANGTGTDRDMQIVTAGTAGLRMDTSQLIGIGSGVTMAATFPALKRSSTVLEHRLADDSAYGPVAASELRQYGGETGGFIARKSKTELTTIAAAATTDTTITIPAGVRVIAVSVRVTVAIPTAATFEVGINGAASRFATGVLVAANTTNVGTLGSYDDDYAAAIAVRITPNLTPANNSGRVRVTIHYDEVTPPTS